MKVYDGILDEKNKIATVSFTEVGEVNAKALIKACKTRNNVFLLDEDKILKTYEDFKGQRRSNFENLKVIFQDKTTILIDGDKKYFARPEKGEKFDAEKGLLVCLMKKFGVTTSDLLKIRENAKVCQKAVKCDKVKTTKRR